MERYDAILEQLKKAQSRGMETITNRLDFVVQSLEELIQETKLSVQGALPETANECLPVAEVEAALDAYREEADAERQRADELDAKIGELVLTAEDAPQAPSIDLMRALDDARSQSELLKELLPAISEHVARAVVLVLRDGMVSAWSGIGFTDGEILRAWQGETAESSALAKLLEVSKPVQFAPAEDNLFQGWLANQETPGKILLIPVVLRGKMMGTVYVDQLEGHPWNPETAQTLVALVCWLIDTLQYRKLGAPTLAEPVEIDQAVEVTEPEETPVEEDAAPEDEEPADEAEAETEAEEKEEEEFTAEEAEAVEKESDEPEQKDPELEASEEDPSATMRVDVSGMGFTETPSADEVVTESVVAETEPDTEAEIAGESFEPDEPAEPDHDAEIISESFEPDEPAEPDPEFDAVQETEFEPEVDEHAEEIPPEEPVEAEPAPSEPEEVPPAIQMPVTPPEDEEKEPSTSRFLDEPPPVKPVQPPSDEPEEEISEDEAQREEARRFARLLVSEIKLYNEEQVERGRESKDIYQRLREDIDRSREMFEKRISAEVREIQDYFRDELVGILADGDPDLLGM